MHITTMSTLDQHSEDRNVGLQMNVTSRWYECSPRFTKSIVFVRSTLGSVEDHQLSFLFALLSLLFLPIVLQLDFLTTNRRVTSSTWRQDRFQESDLSLIVVRFVALVMISHPRNSFQLSLSITKYINNSVSMARLRLEISLLIMLLFSHFLLSKNAISRFFLDVSQLAARLDVTFASTNPDQRQLFLLSDVINDHVTVWHQQLLLAWRSGVLLRRLTQSRHNDTHRCSYQEFLRQSRVCRDDGFVFCLVVFHGYGLFPLFWNRKFVCVVHVFRYFTPNLYDRVDNEHFHAVYIYF